MQSPQEPVAIVCWDLSHNPVGRAYVLYRLLEQEWPVELVGPIWPRFGSGLWPPLRGENLSIKSFSASSLGDLWREGAALGLTRIYRFVYICKPRLPSMILGLLLAERNRCPIIVDIDEDELAFSPRRPGRLDVERELIEEPFGALGTQLALQHIGLANAVTVSNPSLLKHFSGHLVRHARSDLTVPIDRIAARQRLGLADDDFVIAFLGTTRAHKGLTHVLTALRQLADPSVRLLLAGTIDSETDREIARHGLSAQVLRHHEFRISECSDLLAAADLVPLLQHPDAMISQTQMPAKFTDALRAGVRVVATDVPPLREMSERGAVDIIGATASDFYDYLVRVRAERSTAETAERNRRVFQQEFSFAANRPRLRAAVSEALARKPVVAAKITGGVQELLRKTQAACANLGVCNDQQEAARPAPKARTFDVAFFWKQNDSELFGRRSDMVAKHLLKSGRVNKIVHFDHALTLGNLRHMAARRARAPGGVEELQLRTTLHRAMQLSDDPRLKRRLFISPGECVSKSFLGRELGAQTYAAFVRHHLALAGLQPEKTVAWVCPVVSEFADLAREVGFRKVVCDLIDDERSWPASDALRAELQTEYEATLRASDLVLTNCEENRIRFAPWHSGIVIVPNGAEIDDPSCDAEPPSLLRELPHPVIGYVGNLRSRIDWDIVTGIAQRRPHWSIVLAGPADEECVPTLVRDLANVSLPGPVTYAEGRSLMRGFDVAFLPHVVSDLTRAMNPLKVYNYLAAGCPVVCTPVANLDDVADLVSVRHDTDGFIAAIEIILAGECRKVPLERIRQFSWEQRVDEMLREINRILD